MAPQIRYRVFILFTIAALLAACNAPAGGTEDAVPSAAVSAPAPQTVGQCSNPLQPVVIGATWTYSVSGITTGTFTRSITAVHDTGFSDQDVFDSGVTRTGDWHCENGNLTALSPAEDLSAMVRSDNMQAEFKTMSSSGVTLPAIIRPGDSWNQAFTIEGTTKVGGETAESKGDMTYSCTAGQTETVVVPAGSFDSVRIGCQINGTITVTMGKIQAPVQIASAATMWYARNVGMVKTENEVSGVGHSTIVLTSYTIP